MPEHIGGDGASPRSQDGLAVLLLEDRRPWPRALLEMLAREGYSTVCVGQIERVPSMLVTGAFIALLIGARPRGMRDRLILKRCRETSPEVAVVVSSTECVKPDFKQALETGATAFLPWPLTSHLLKRALMSGIGTGDRHARRRGGSLADGE
jgi:DNA-binding NtrC family response regulator